MKKSLLLSSWIFSFGNSLSSPLLSLYFYVTSSLKNSLEFLLINPIFILVAYILCGYVTNFYNRVTTIYRIGIVLNVLFYTALLLLNVNASRLVYPLSIFYGVAQGIYWFAWDVLFFFTPKKLDFFNKSAYLGVITAFLSPAIYGIILSIFHEIGYLILFSLTSIILALAAFLVENVNIHSRFTLLNSIKVYGENKTYKFIMTSDAIVTGASYVISNLNSILTYQVAKSYINFAMLNYALTLISLSSTYVIRQRLISKVNKMKLVLASSTALMISGLSIFVFPLIYLIVFSLTSPLVNPLIDLYAWNNMRKELITAFLVNRQIFFDLSRVFFSSLEALLFVDYLVSEEILFVLPAFFISAILFVKSGGKQEVT